MSWSIAAWSVGGVSGTVLFCCFLVLLEARFGVLDKLRRLRGERVGIHLRLTDATNLASVRAHTSVRTVRGAFVVALRMLSELESRAVPNIFVILFHPGSGRSITLLRALRGAALKQDDLAPDLRLRLSDKQIDVVDDLMRKGVASTRAGVLRRALSDYAFIAERVSRGWVLAADKGTSVLEIPVPAVRRRSVAWRR